MKKILLVALAAVFLGGCASLKGSSEPLNISSNEPNTVFFLGAQEIGKETSATVNIQKRMHDLINSEISKPETQTQWRDGIKRDFQLDMQRMEINIEILDEEIKDGTSLLAVRVNFIIYCLDENSVKKRVLGNIDGMVLITDPDDASVWPFQILQIEKMTVHDGWNGKDI